MNAQIEITATFDVVFLEGVDVNLHFHCGLVFSTFWTFNSELSTPLATCLGRLSMLLRASSIMAPQSPPFDDPPTPCTYLEN